MTHGDSTTTAPTPPEQSPRRFGRLRTVLNSLALIAAVAGVAAVAVVVVTGLSGHRVPAPWVAPFLILLPVAFVCVALSVIVGAVQRKHT